MRNLSTPVVLCAFLVALVCSQPFVVSAQVPAPAPTQAPQPAFPQPAATPQVDPRVTQFQVQIKANIQNAGLRVIEQGYHAPSMRWVVSTEAKYAHPSRQAVGWQHLTVWGAMFGVLSQEPPASSVRSGQMWGKYSIVSDVTLEALRAYARAWQAAQTDADRTAAQSALWRGVATGIWDIERQQWVDEKDFVAKNFTG